MSGAKETTSYLVDGHSDPAILRISGRASYTNCAPVAKFFSRMVEGNKHELLVDFDQCSGMDSTFLGILAGAALDFRKMKPPGIIRLCRLNERNLELVRNLGLHRILEVACDASALRFDASKGSPTTALSRLEKSDTASANTILQAHENLVKADEDNRQKFEDVLTFLRIQVEADAEEEDQDNPVKKG